MEQVQQIVANAASVHVLGLRHSFNDIADSSELLSPRATCPADVVVDHEAHTVSLVEVTYGDLVKTLHDEGWPYTLASLPTSVAGAVATATHGSGVTCGNLRDSGRGLEIRDVSGEIIEGSSEATLTSTAWWSDSAPSGAVTRITLTCSPPTQKQRCSKALYDHFDEITSCGYSVSIFTAGARRMTRSGSRAGWMNPTVLRVTSRRGCSNGWIGHPIVELDPTLYPSWACPASGPTAYRISGMGYTPSGAEIQSEYLVPRRRCQGHRSRARPRRPDPTNPAGERDSPGGRGSAVDEHELRGRLRRHPLHLEARARRGPGDSRPDRGCPYPVRGAPALGQGLPCGRSGNRSALQAPFPRRPPGGAARPARRVPQLMAEDPRARRQLNRVWFETRRIPWGSG